MRTWPARHWTIAWIGESTSSVRICKIVENANYILRGEHSGAITADGAVLMWGINDLGQLGIATAGQAIPTPVQIVGELREKRAYGLSLGVYHSCCVTEDGSLYANGLAGMESLVTAVIRAV